MAFSDFNKYKDIDVRSVSGTPNVDVTVPLKIVDGNDSTTGTGDIVLDWANISTEADIGVYDETETLLDYYFESFDSTAKTAVIWVYRSWVRDGTTQLKIAYGNGPSDQSVVASTVFDKESSLEAGYLYNESSGDLLDVTSNNNDGTLNGGVTQGATGIVDGAYDFDGIDDYINVDGSNFDFLTQNGIYTKSFWGKLTSAGGFHGIIDLYNGSGNWAFVGFRDVDSDSKTNYFASIRDTNGNKDEVYIDGVDYADDVWHYYSFIIDGFGTSNMRLFVDGTEKTTTNSASQGASSFTINGTLYIGGVAADRDEYDDCFMDFATIYSSAEPAEKITAQYDATKSSPDFFSQQAAQNTTTPKAPGYFIAQS